MAVASTPLLQQVVGERVSRRERCGPAPPLHDCSFQHRQELPWLGELGEAITAGRRLVHVRTGSLVIIRRSGLSHLPQTYVRIRLVAIVEADETARLERFAERDGLRVTENPSRIRSP